MAQVYSFGSQNAANKVVEQVKKRVAELSKMHPAAKLIMGLATFLIIAAAVYTGYHNYELYRRITSSPLVALVPPLLLDGSMLLLLGAFIFWFTDSTQKLLAGLFNLALFLIIGFNTSLNGSLESGEQLAGWMRLYLDYGIIASFLFVLGAWMLIFHLDPIIKRNEERAKLNAQAQQTAHEVEVEQMQLQMENDKAELQYQLKLSEAMHSARMKALDSEDVKDALIDWEKENALIEAKNIRGTLPLPKDKSR
jgi:hypothetical protein